MKKTKEQKKTPPSQVIALYDHDPIHDEVQHENLPAFIAPDLSVQLAFRRGEKFEVIGKELDWWLRCRSLSSGKEGYVPTVYLAPLVTEKDNCDGREDGEKQKLMPYTSEMYFDIEYFPNSPISRQKRPCPESSANIFSILTFFWLDRLMIKGFKRTLTEADLWELDVRNQASTVEKKFEDEWHKEMHKWENSPMVEVKTKKDTKGDKAENEIEVSLLSNQQPPELTKEHKYMPSISKALCKAFGPMYLVAIILKFLHDVLIFASPYLLGKLITFVQSDTEELKWGYIYAVGLLLVVTCQTLLLHQYFQRAYLTGMHVRSALIAAIYKKMLKLSLKGRRDFTAGEMVNLMTVDAQKCADLLTYLNILWSGPFQIVVALGFLYQLMGWSIVAGFVVLLLLIPLNYWVASIIKKLFTKHMSYKDSRSKLMNEILSGIKVIKFYAWEESFISKVMGCRTLELNQLKEINKLNARHSLARYISPFLVSCATFTAYILSGNELTAKKAFVAISLFNVIRFPLTVIPMVISNVIQYFVSAKRLSKFLRGDEIDYADVTRLDSSVETANVVEIKDGCFTWLDPEKPVLSNINVQIPQGKLIAIVGQVGCGKTSMLSSILGEIHKVNGEVLVQGKIAYVPQQAWVKNETLQDNILFGKTLLQQKYNNIIKACALQPDLDVLQLGDMTEIGEKGINLSGGQKQRVSIARAVYNNADIYLLDDPLSAVDAHVGKHIFNHVIGPNGLLKNKTRVLVTHNMSFLPLVDQIIVLKDNEISEVGCYDELVSNREDFSEFLQTYHNTTTNDGEDDVENTSLSKPTEVIEGDVKDISNVKVHDRSESLQFLKTMSASTFSLLDEIDGPCEEFSIQEMLNKHEEIVKQEYRAAGNIIQEETTETGRVKRSVFAIYGKSFGILFASSLLCFAFLYEASLVGSNWWLARWTDQVNTTISDNKFYLGIYGSFGAGQAIFALIHGYVLAYASYASSKTLHDGLLKNILRCPMSFFDATPMGRIVNRFSKDIHVIDEMLPMNLKVFIATLMQMFGTIFIISYSTPMFLTVLLPLSVLYLFTQRYYVASSRQLKRIESVNRSPIYNHFFESINGASTIRAYQYEQKFLQENKTRIDTNQMAFFPSMTSNRWLAVRLEFCGNLISFFAALFCIVQKDKISAGIAGLSISYSLMVTQSLNWMVRQTCELETNIISVERIKEYTDLPTEAPAVLPKNQPERDWPDSGNIKFMSYSVQYRTGLELVLKDLNCDISPSEKIGIVGRTGAGKSSIANALFRILEATSGKIFIDGVDIAAIGLNDLRSKVTIIPQDPVLFAATLRFNLDPFNQFDDGELWKALEVAHLKTFVSGVDGGLDYEVTENGENLSVGQRQLVCLARALLRKTKILLLDEATASVDLETDSFIQQTIREEFQNCTILTIAHRLNTIIDYDRILVLHEGKIVEFDTPNNLLAKQDGLFYSMAIEAGVLGSMSK